MAAGLGAAIRAKAVELRDALAGPGGIPTTLEPAQVPVPGAWVSFARAKPETMTSYAVRFHVYLVVPASGSQLQTLDALAELLTAALEIVEPEDDDEAITATAVELPHTPGTRLPAYRLVVDVLADIDDEE